MKVLRFTLFALALAIAAPITSVEAIVSSQNSTTEVVAAPTSEPTISKKQQRRLDRLEKLLAKQEARAAKNAAVDEKVDFEDPINKWMWFWLLGWGAGLVFGILGAGVIYGLWYLSYLCWTAGTICLIIWLLKKTGTI